jgi:hypothetical protein
MPVTCRNTVKDFEKLQSYVLRHTESGRRSARSVFWWMTGLFALFCLVVGIFVHWAMAVACFAGGTVFFWLTKELAIVSQVKREYAKEAYRHLFEPVTVSVEESGLRTERAGGGGFYRWAVVDRVADTGDHLFVIMGAQGHIAIPAEAFESTDHKEAFYKSVSERIDGSRPVDEP